MIFLRAGGRLKLTVMRSNRHIREELIMFCPSTVIKVHWVNWLQHLNRTGWKKMEFLANC
jgi:hypothetical protein